MAYHASEWKVMLMEIGIIGAGSIGLLYSFYLSKNYTVTLYTNRKEQADIINEEGITVIKDGTQSLTKVHAEYERNYQEQLLIISVKQYDIEPIIEVLKKLSSRTVLFLQNGMGHLPFLSLLSHHKIVLGIVEHGALRIDVHTVEHTGIGRTKLSYYNSKNSDNTWIEQLLVEKHPCFPIELKEDWQKMLNEKLIANATINPLTTILKVKNGELIENEHFNVLLYELFTEIINVLGLQNERQLWDYVQNICKNTAQNESSMYKDVQKGNQTEIDAILGYCLHQAKNRNLAMPHITFLYHSIKGIEVRKGERDG
jgi:2-dehydropantoate 2-reductase